MGSFDAGSIEGRLDIDTSPFTAGLDEARAKADEWEAKPIRKRVELDDADAKAKMDAFDAEESRRDINQKVDVDTRPASRKMDEFRAEQRAKNAASGGGGGGGLGGLAGLGMPALIAAGVGLAPGLGPIGASAGLSGFVGGSMFTQFMGATLLMKTMTTEAIKAAQQAATIVSRPLPKNATALQKAHYEQALATMKDSKAMLDDITKLQSTWQALYQDPAVFKMIDTGATTLTTFLPKLQPLISSIAKGFIPVINELGHSLNGSGFGKFEHMLSNNYRTMIPVWGDSIIKTLGGIGGVMEATNPEMKSFSHEVDSLMTRFDRWGNNGGAKKFFDSWNAYDAQFKPQLHQLGGDVLGGLGHLLGPQGLGNPTLAHGALGMLDGIFSTLSHADLSPLRNALAGIQAMERSIGPGVSTALPGILNAVGAVEHLASQVNWKIVGTAINYTADGVNKLADAAGALNQHFGGMLGDIAGIGIVGLGVKGIASKFGLIGGSKGSAGGLLGAAESAVGMGGKGVAVHVTNWPGGGLPGGGGNPLVTAAEDAAGGAAGWSLWGGIKGAAGDFRATAGADGLIPAIKNLPASVASYLSVSKVGAGLTRLSSIAEGLSPEGIAFLLAGNPSATGLGSGVKGDRFGGLYSPSTPQSAGNKFWSFLPGLQSDGSQRTPTYYFPKGTNLTAGATDLHANDMNAHVSGTSNYAFFQELARSGLLSGMKQNKGFLSYSGTDAALTSAIKLLGQLSHVGKDGKLVSPGKNFGVMPEPPWLKSWYKDMGLHDPHKVVKQAPWDAIVKYLSQTATDLHSKGGIAGLIDIKKWEHDLGAGFTKALNAQMHPAKAPSWITDITKFLNPKLPGSPAAAKVAPDPNLAKLLDSSLQMNTGQRQTKTAIDGVHKVMGDVKSSVDNSRNVTHSDLAQIHSALGTLAAVTAGLAPQIAAAVSSANAALIQSATTAARAGHK